MGLLSNIRRAHQRQKYEAGRSLIAVSKPVRDRLELIAVAENTTLRYLAELFITEGIHQYGKRALREAKTQRDKEWAEKCLQS